MRDRLGSTLGYLKVLVLQVAEEVTTLQVLHDDVNIIRVLEHVV